MENCRWFDETEIGGFNRKEITAMQGKINEQVKKRQQIFDVDEKSEPEVIKKALDTSIQIAQTNSKIQKSFKNKERKLHYQAQWILKAMRYVKKEEKELELDGIKLPPIDEELEKSFSRLIPKMRKSLKVSPKKKKKKNDN